MNSLTQDKHPDKSISDSPNRLTTLGCRYGLQLQGEWLHFTSPKRFLGDRGALWQAVTDYKSHKCQSEGETAERSGQSELIVVSELTLLSVPEGRLELSSWTSFRTVRVKVWTLPSSSRRLLLHLCSSCLNETLQLEVNWSLTVSLSLRSHFCLSYSNNWLSKTLFMWRCGRFK